MIDVLLLMPTAGFLYVPGRQVIAAWQTIYRISLQVDNIHQFNAVGGLPSHEYL